MNMRTILDPFGGTDPLIDKVIGPTAFDVVRYVALNMKHIQYVGANMEKIDVVYRDIKATYTVKGKTGQAGESVTLALPFPNLPKEITNIEVYVRTADHAVYTAASGYLRWSMNGTTLQCRLDPAAPPQLENAELVWVLTGG